MHLCCLVFLFYIGFSGAAVYFEYQKLQPGKIPFCVDKNEGKKKVGEEWYNINECTRMRCHTDSQGSPLITYHSCGAVAVKDPNCRIVKPTEPLPYPDCCPMPLCDEKVKHDNY